MILFEEKSLAVEQVSKVAAHVFQRIQQLTPEKNVLLLKGPMAAGKTTFVRQLVESLGGEGIQSPTFALHQRYSLEAFDIEHLDLFRIQSELELDGIGFWDLFAEPKNLIIVEWPEKMTLSHFPKDWNLYQLSITADEFLQTRSYIFEIIENI